MRSRGAGNYLPRILAEESLTGRKKFEHTKPHERKVWSKVERVKSCLEKFKRSELF